MATRSESVESADVSGVAIPTACPSCGNDVLNVQGIHTCSTCSWLPGEHR